MRKIINKKEKFSEMDIYCVLALCQAPIQVFHVYDFIQSSQSLSEEDTVIIILNSQVGKLRHPAVMKLA